METAHHARGTSLREVEFDAGADILAAPATTTQKSEVVEDVDDVDAVGLLVDAPEKSSDWEAKGSEDHEVEGNGFSGNGAARLDADNEAWNTYNDVMLGTPASPNNQGSFSEITPVVESMGAAQDSSDLGNMPVQIWVSNPKQVEEISKLGIKSAYTSYFVKSQTDLSTYPFKQRAVWRRFRDFDTLHRLLRSNHPGYFCPPLPNKDFLAGKRAKEEFVKIRQGDLQKFLRQLVMHPAMLETQELKFFLGLPEELAMSREWGDLLRASIKTEVEVEQPGPKTPGKILKKDILKTMRKVGDSFKKDVLKRTRTVSENEKRLKDAAFRLRFLESELGACFLKSRALISCFEGLMEELHGMGKMFMAMAKFEEGASQNCGQYTEIGRAAATIAADMQKAGYATLRVYHFHRKYIVSTLNWVSTLEDNLNIVPAAIAAMGDRVNALGTVHACEDRLEGTRQRLDDLTRESSKKLGGLSNFSAKSAQLSAEINNLVAELGRLSEEYDRIRLRNEEENMAFTCKRHTSLATMVQGLAQDQAALNESISVAWKALAEQLGKGKGPVESPTA